MSKFDTDSLCLIEKDRYGDYLVAWNYPGVSLPVQAICIKTAEAECQNAKFLYFKIKNDWVYISTSSKIKDINPDLLGSSLCIISRTFNPEKFSKMGTVLHGAYDKSSDPTKILEGFLSVHTTGKCAGYDPAEFDASKAKKSDGCAMKELIGIAGMDIAVLWNAVMLKKRILVHGAEDSLELVLRLVRTLPFLCLHRKGSTSASTQAFYDVLRPVVRADAEQLEDLNTCGVFIAGSVDQTITSHDTLFDVTLFVSERKVVVATHAVDKMRMTSVHRELAQSLATNTADYTNQELVEKVENKTTQVLDLLKSCVVDNGKVTTDSIKEQVTSVAVQLWLSRVALAENMIST